MKLLSNKKVKELFQANLDQLTRSAGHSLTLEAQEQAFMQTILYNHKLHELAEAVTETEVELLLPDQFTPNGIFYTLMGIIDVVIDEDGAKLYDFKTMDAHSIKEKMLVFKHQIQMYIHNWQELRGDIPIVEAAIIATNPPKELKGMTMETTDLPCNQTLIEQWDPKIPIDLDEQPTIEETILFIGKIIDQIENDEFAPQPLERLLEKYTPSSKQTFATRVCTNCDARHSCESFQTYTEWKRTKRKAS